MALPRYFGNTLCGHAGEHTASRTKLYDAFAVRTNSPFRFSQHSFIKPAELFLYVVLIIASQRSRIACSTFWCPSGYNAINHLWLLLLQADICSEVSHWLSGLGPLPPPTHAHMNTPQLGIRNGWRVLKSLPVEISFDFPLESMFSSVGIWKAVEGDGFQNGSDNPSSNPGPLFLSGVTWGNPSQLSKLDFQMCKMGKTVYVPPPVVLSRHRISI